VNAALPFFGANAAFERPNFVFMVQIALHGLFVVAEETLKGRRHLGPLLLELLLGGLAAPHP